LTIGKFYRRFGGFCCLHHHCPSSPRTPDFERCWLRNNRYCVISRKILIFILVLLFSDQAHDGSRLLLCNQEYVFLVSLFDSFQFGGKSLVAERETIRNLEVINL